MESELQVKLLNVYILIKAVMRKNVIIKTWGINYLNFRNEKKQFRTYYYLDSSYLIFWKNQCKYDIDKYFLLKWSTTKTERLSSIKLSLFNRERLSFLIEFKYELPIMENDHLMTFYNQSATTVILFTRKNLFSLKTG